MIFTSDEWRLFLDTNKIPIQAGVPPRSLVQLAVKELVDNALDAGNNVKWDLLYEETLKSDNSDPEITQANSDKKLIGFYVQDDGAGLPGDSPEQIAYLFSVSRPFVSSKAIRLPTRGALGNGLRVVSGIAHTSGGHITVTSKGQRFRIALDETTGTAHAVDIQPDSTPGTRIDIVVGPQLRPCLHDAGAWGDTAVFLAGKGQAYKGKTSAFWYDSGSFFALCKGAPENITVRQIVSGDEGFGGFDGCTGTKAGHIAEPFKNILAKDLSRDQSDVLLERMRKDSSHVKPGRLGCLGPDAYNGHSGLVYHYAKTTGTFKIDSDNLPAFVPYVVEAWAAPGQPLVNVTVNSTPITSSLSSSYSQKEKYLLLGGCGLSGDLTAPRITKINRSVTVFVNIITPYMRILSAGKSPDLSPMSRSIIDAIGKAARKAAKADKSGAAQSFKLSMRDVVFDNILAAAEKASGGYAFSLRQTYYVIRPIVRDLTGNDLDYSYFSSRLITDYEIENGEIPGMYRDPRGILYHPHLHQDIPLGTLSVAKYKRPEWTFNKVLFIEKEGLVQALKQIHWPERNDCALVTSKGQATRAVKDVIDLLAESDEPIRVFCIHDADAAGTMIYQTLQEETRSRGRRKIEIVNLGLEPWEALKDGLDPETVKYDKRQAVANYVQAVWEKWLQTHRVELNAMTSPQFLKWLDRQFAPYAGKLIPPHHVLETETQDALRRDVREKILLQLDERINQEVESQIEQFRPDIDQEIQIIDSSVKEHLASKPADSWRDAVGAVINKIVPDTLNFDIFDLPVTLGEDPVQAPEILSDSGTGVS